MRLAPALWLTWHYLRHVSRGISVTAPTEALQEPPPPPWIGQQRKVGSGFYEHPVKRLPKGWLICALFQEKNFSDLGETLYFSDLQETLYWVLTHCFAP